MYNIYRRKLVHLYKKHTITWQNEQKTRKQVLHIQYDGAARRLTNPALYVYGWVFSENSTFLLQTKTKLFSNSKLSFGANGSIKCCLYCSSMCPCDGQVICSEDTRLSTDVCWRKAPATLQRKVFKKMGGNIV